MSGRAHWPLHPNLNLLEKSFVNLSAISCCWSIHIPQSSHNLVTNFFLLLIFTLHWKKVVFLSLFKSHSFQH